MKKLIALAVSLLAIVGLCLLATAQLPDTLPDPVSTVTTNTITEIPIFIKIAIKSDGTFLSMIARKDVVHTLSDGTVRIVPKQVDILPALTALQWGNGKWTNEVGKPYILANGKWCPKAIDVATLFNETNIVESPQP